MFKKIAINIEVLGDAAAYGTTHALTSYFYHQSQAEQSSVMKLTGAM